MIEVLLPIWQRVLRASSTGVNENFFDLGGDSLLAVELFTEIARVCGRELPAVLIYQAPTVAELAALLEKNNAPGFPPLVPLKNGSQKPPVFITHGLGGSVIDFFQVIRNLKTDHAIYGMQAKGIDGVEQPFERIEDMAQYYLDGMQHLQPSGPYALIGFSLGGLVTLEMAHRLSEKGEKIALLAMLDSYPHSRYLEWSQKLQLRAQLLNRHISVLKCLPAGQAFSYLLRRSERQAYLPGDSSRKLRYEFSSPASPAMARVRESARLALATYRPRFYAGRVKFVRAEISTDFPEDAAAVWRNLVSEVQVETVPGDHIGIMTNHADSLARVLSRYLDEI